MKRRVIISDDGETAFVWGNNSLRGPKPSFAGKAVLPDRGCAHCGQQFTPIEPRHTYCSRRCRKRYVEANRRQRLEALEGAQASNSLRKRYFGDPNPPEREGPTFPLTQRLPGSYGSNTR